MYVSAINVSEGSDRLRIQRIRDAADGVCVDVHSDPDHNRSVLTLAAAEVAVVEAAVRSLTREAYEILTILDHTGVHPRFGAVDVVPFATTDVGDAAEDAIIAAAQRYAAWVASEFAVPAFLFDLADPQHRSLPEVRRDAFGGRAPDAGPTVPHPRLGAVAVSAQPLLIAVNVQLATTDLSMAKAIAREIRERDGGLPRVRALGFPLESQCVVQVSMNLIDARVTGMEAACTAVRDAAAAQGVEALGVELVGLISEREYDRWSEGFRQWSGLDRSVTVEARVAAVAD